MALILVVDDDALVRSTVCEMLESLGHDACAAADGASAERLYREQTFDLVVSDLIMPEQEGLVTIRALRRFDPSVRVVAMSGGGPSIDAEPLLAAAVRFGAYGVLHKPFDLTTLGASVQAALR